MLHALEENKIQKGDVVVIRYEGPQGGPGMPEMLTPTSAIMGAGLGSDVAMLTDGRFSGGSHGFIVGHITPEAQTGGPLGCCKMVTSSRSMPKRIDWTSTSATTNWPDASRRGNAPPLKATRGTLYKYIKCVKTASEGCVTDE